MRGCEQRVELSGIGCLERLLLDSRRCCSGKLCASGQRNGAKNHGSGEDKFQFELSLSAREEWMD
jgi:hypothetical protein